MINVQVLRKFVLNGTIDGHDPIGVVFRITGGDKPFRLVVVSVNWGRGYKPGEFHDNVMRVLDATDESTYVVLLIQELDEADGAPERRIFMAEMEDGTTLVPQPPLPGRETIAVSPSIDVRRARRVMTMDQGSHIGAPKGTGPRRFFVSCMFVIHGVRIGVGDQHPHRVDPDWSKENKRIVENARERGEHITEVEVRMLVELCDLTVHGGDMNDKSYPKSHPKEKVAHERGLDTIRYIVA
jgi:hypothetical protein